MAATLRKLPHKGSVISTFEILPVADLFKLASQRKGGGLTPTLLRPDEGNPLLLVADKTGAIEGFEIHAKKGARLPRGIFDTEQLLDHPDFKLVRVGSVVVCVNGVEFGFRNGKLKRRSGGGGMRMLRWNEVPPKKS